MNLKMYVLTNRRGIYGASFIADKQVLGSIAEKLGGDFAILPSSVHELIIIPEIKKAYVAGIENNGRRCEQDTGS